MAEKRNADPIVLKCECGTTWAVIENDAFKVIASHHGERHTNALSLLEAIRLSWGEDWTDVFQLALTLKGMRAKENAN